MKLERSEKYNIAWFKLAECVSRREKERALGVYRLLSHSFDNVAVAHQLEGDILLAFEQNDEAREQYEKAAKAYKQQEQVMQAIAVYDHLTMLAQCDWYFKEIIALYQALGKTKRVLDYTKR